MRVLRAKAKVNIVRPKGLKHKPKAGVKSVNPFKGITNFAGSLFKHGKF